MAPQQPPLLPSGPETPYCLGSTITLRRTTVGRTPLDEWSARRKDLYQTKHNNHNRQQSMSSGGIRTHNPSKRAATDPRLRPRVHRDRQGAVIFAEIQDSVSRSSHSL